MLDVTDQADPKWKLWENRQLTPRTGSAIEAMHRADDDGLVLLGESDAPTALFGASGVGDDSKPDLGRREDL